MLKTIAGFLCGILVCLGFVTTVEHFDSQRNEDRCLASAVRAYPTIGDADLVVGNLSDCKHLSSDQLSDVRSQLQAFGTEAVRRVASHA